MSRLVGIDLIGGSAPWAALGLTVDDDDSIRVGEVVLRFGAAAPRLRIWADEGVADGDLDGVEVVFAQPAEPATSDGVRHPIAASLIDHVVIMTPSLPRTVAAAESVLRGPLRRERDAGNGVRQGFFRMGEAILEIVESPHVPAGPAEFWGLVLIVDDLLDVCDRLGPDLVGLPKRAVQPGRMIATVRASAGLGCPVALMSTSGTPAD